MPANSRRALAKVWMLVRRADIALKKLLGIIDDLLKSILDAVGGGGAISEIKAGDGAAETPSPHKVAVNLESCRHRFNLGVVVQHLLAHLASPARLLIAAEGERCVEDVVAIDPHCASAQSLGHLVG
jgi:hypothetical protein